MIFFIKLHPQLKDIIGFDVIKEFIGAGDQLAG